MPLGMAARLWPTPTARDYRSVTGREHEQRDNHLQNLNVAVTYRERWPTPTTSDGNGGPGSSGRDGGDNLRTAVGGSLNPTWVDWLMGLPVGWTDCEHLATRSSRKSSSPLAGASSKRDDDV